jgi:hypothetical protein
VELKLLFDFFSAAKPAPSFDPHVEPSVGEVRRELCEFAEYPDAHDAVQVAHAIDLHLVDAGAEAGDQL